MAEHLIAGGHEVAFIGTPGSLEAQLVPAAGIPFRAVRAEGFDRGRPLSLVRSGLVVASSIRTARALIRSQRTDVVIGFGGYVSLPVGLAAVLSRTPLVLHEQNSVPGLANRILSRWATAVGVTYEGSLKHLTHPDRAVLTGNPVRQGVLGADRARGREALGLDPSATVLLVFGGSRGARHINDRLLELAPTLMGVPSLQVVHVAGRIDHASVTERAAGQLGADAHRYHVVDYIDAMGDAIAAADVIVARAGATSIAEITAIGRAAVLVPYPYATDDHQTLNARAVSSAGAAEVIPDAALDAPEFADALLRIIGDPQRREAMAAASAALARRDAAERVMALVLGAVSPDGKG